MFRGGHTQGGKPGSKWALCSRAQAFEQFCAATLTQAGNIGQVFFLPVQPIEQPIEAALVDQLHPGARPNPGKGQPLFTAEPNQPCQELLLTAGNGLPTTQWVVGSIIGRIDRGSICTAQDYVIQASDGQACKADRHLITGTDIECFPALQ
ncbi:hypothetical protein D3C76_931060 [compost metagenome]